MTAVFLDGVSSTLFELWIRTYLEKCWEYFLAYTQVEYGNPIWVMQPTPILITVFQNILIMKKHSTFEYRLMVDILENPFKQVHLIYYWCFPPYSWSSSVQHFYPLSDHFLNSTLGKLWWLVLLVNLKKNRHTQLSSCLCLLDSAYSHSAFFDKNRFVLWSRNILLA